jgi:hypothetical protein
VASLAAPLATQEAQLTRLSAGLSDQLCSKVFTELMVLLTSGRGYSLSVVRPCLKKKKSTYLCICGFELNI